MVCAERQPGSFDHQIFNCGAELPALAPGARCRVGRSIESGAPEADLWTSAVNGAVDGANLLQEMSHQERQGSVEKCWSRGRIVSALLAGAQGGFLPSVGPPNPIATQSDGTPMQATPGAGSDIGLYRRQWGFMKGTSSSSGVIRAAPATAAAVHPRQLGGPHGRPGPAGNGRLRPEALAGLTRRCLSSTGGWV